MGMSMTAEDTRRTAGHGPGGAGDGEVESTEALARRAAAGDDRALPELLRRIEPDVMRRCRRFLPYQQDAEEAAQDTLLIVARKIGTFQGRSKFSTWLYEVNANCARQTYRSLKRRAAEAPAWDDTPPERPDPARTSIIAGSRIDLLDALEQLEEHRRDLVEPVVLRDVAGLEYSEIADRLGIPLGTVKSRIHEARKQLRTWLVVRD